MSDYSYEINPRPPKVGGGVFPPVEDIDDAEKAVQAAYADALAEAESWIASRG